MENRYIAVIVAENCELEAVREVLDNVENIKIYNLDILKGTMSNQIYLLVKGGVGKVNAARTAQILIDTFPVKYIINIGSAASTNPNLKIGDIVLGEKLVQHDFNVTAFGHPRGYISDIGTYFNSDISLLEKCSHISIANQKVIKGTIASGDIFCADKEMIKKIRKRFSSDCIEMEGAAIAQVCSLDSIPFIVIRSISDTLEGNNKIEFEEYLKIASQNCAKFIKEL